MQPLRQHLLTTLAAMIAAAALGTLAGYQLAGYIAVRATESRLDRYAGRIMADGEATSVELRTVLAAVSASRYHTCSNAEIDYFRTLIFAPEYLKDAGRPYWAGPRSRASLLYRISPSRTGRFFTRTWLRIGTTASPPSRCNWGTRLLCSRLWHVRHWSRRRCTIPRR
jgi:hypothetical protein